MGKKASLQQSMMQQKALGQHFEITALNFEK